MSSAYPVNFVHSSRVGAPGGFTMLEMLTVLIFLGLIVAITVPQLAHIFAHSRVNYAATVVAADLQNGFAMAGRQRAPVRITLDPVEKSYSFTDRVTGKLLQKRVLNELSEFKLTKLDVSPTPTIDVFPNGIASVPFTLTLGVKDYERKITASTAGFVRLVPLGTGASAAPQI